MAVEFCHAFGREVAAPRKFEDTIWKLSNCESTVSSLVLCMRTKSAQRGKLSKLEFLSSLQLNFWLENSHLYSVDLTGIENLNLSRMVKSITLNQKILRKCELQYPSGRFQTPMALLLIILILVHLVSFVLHLAFHFILCCNMDNFYKFLFQIVYERNSVSVVFYIL